MAIVIRARGGRAVATKPCLDCSSGHRGSLGAFIPIPVPIPVTREKMVEIQRQAQMEERSVISPLTVKREKTTGEKAVEVLVFGIVPAAVLLFVLSKIRRK